MTTPSLSLAEYEASRPAGEQKIVFEEAVVRAYVKNGEIAVLINRKDANGHEELPLAYMLGSNAAILKARR